MPGEDVAAIPSPQTGRRITSAYIFPSSTSLEASSHYSLSLTSLNSGSDPGHLPSSLEHQPHHGREDIHQISQDVPRFVTAASSLQECLTMKKESVRGKRSCPLLCTAVSVSVGDDVAMCVHVLVCDCAPGAVYTFV